MVFTKYTLIVVTGDHGESLGEENVWFNHGGQLNDAEDSCPLGDELAFNPSRR